MKFAVTGHRPDKLYGYNLMRPNCMQKRSQLPHAL